MKSILLFIFSVISVAAFSQTDTTTYGYAHDTLFKAEIQPCDPGWHWRLEIFS
jgi:hypothetical protein